ncbi:MAG: C40 family peptidase [Nocardioidaceae bacterium]|nr:C40 family peptidase [Nocardioidaceae bacterium]
MTARTCVEVATVWTSPDAPRDIDAPATAAVPDLHSWLSVQSAEVRRGLHGRTLTQLLEGEPVDVLEEDLAGWARICAPWQPNPADDGGYVGWVRRSHVELAGGEAPSSPVGPVPPDRIAVVDAARQFVGVRYLWGGLSPYGLDCSGLVHYAYRQAGLVVPRDAHAQAAVVTAVQLGEEQPGDLYFFARADGRVFHVGFVTAPGRMLHAPETGELIEDAPVADDRRATLVAAGRFLSD